jgi:hypothetical protein
MTDTTSADLRSAPADSMSPSQRINNARGGHRAAPTPRKSLGWWTRSGGEGRQRGPRRDVRRPLPVPDVQARRPSSSPPPQRSRRASPPPAWAGGPAGTARGHPPAPGQGGYRLDLGADVSALTVTYPRRLVSLRRIVAPQEAIETCCGQCRVFLGSKEDRTLGKLPVNA